MQAIKMNLGGYRKYSTQAEKIEMKPFYSWKFNKSAKINIYTIYLHDSGYV